ncbi:hypothetical protein [Oceanicola sp. S124]|uniref:hypothetical protein n=1 Tax=Oceanicola sp. S124 TaxID=1042378 RepID=UPI000255A972|nr:hypothetical protein [Oceanicola sp. S124]
MDNDPHTGVFSPTHDALNRMKRAHERGTGCHLTAEMINSLYVTVIGSMWVEDDPRKATPGGSDDQP